MKKQLLGLFSKIGLSASLLNIDPPPSVSTVENAEMLIAKNRHRLIEKERGYIGTTKYNRKGRLRGTPNKRILEKIMSIPFSKSYNKSLQM